MGDFALSTSSSSSGVELLPVLAGYDTIRIVLQLGVFSVSKKWAPAEELVAETAGSSGLAFLLSFLLACDGSPFVLFFGLPDFFAFSIQRSQIFTVQTFFGLPEAG